MLFTRPLHVSPMQQQLNADRKTGSASQFCEKTITVSEQPDSSTKPLLLTRPIALFDQRTPG